MRTVMIFSSGGLESGGGIGRMVGYMVRAWQARPNAPRFVIVDTRGKPRSPAAPLRFALALARLACAGIAGRPLIHVNIAGRGSTLRKALIVGLAKALGLKLVLHLHDYDYEAFLGTLPRPAIGLVRAVFNMADVVVVLGERDRRTVTDALRVPSQRVVVAPNAVPAPPPAQPPRPAGAEIQEILFLGDPSRRKGVHDLLAALVLLSDRTDLPSWRAVIAGGGRELGGFQARARDLGLSSRVAFLGWISEAAARERLTTAAILALPSYAEGLAMSVLEAMSYGLCIVCTPVGALAETLEDGVSALLVRPGDVRGLADALALTLVDPLLRRRLGAGASARFRQSFCAEDYPRRMAEAYRLAGVPAEGAA